MGCHTWFYKKIEVSYEQARTNYLTQIERELAFSERMIKGEIDADLLEAYPEWTPEYGERLKAIFLRHKRLVEGRYCQVATMDKYSRGFEVIRYIPEKGMFLACDSLPHDVFRVYKYPKDKLFSWEETLKFLCNPEKNCHMGGLKHEGIKEYIDTYPLYANLDRYADITFSYNTLKRFWDENPDGMISFG